MIPVEVAQTPWHFTTGLDLLDHWQTVIAGVFALVAAFGTIVVTMIIARRQIGASRDEADRVIEATRAQTRATFKQTEATVTLDQLHDASEALAFHAMLVAAMDRVLAEAAWARKTYPQLMTRRRCWKRWGPDWRQARLPTPSQFASASPRARSRNCAPLASGGAGT